MYLEEEIATHSSIFPWEILWTEEAGGLQFTRLQRVGHDLATKQQQPSYIYSMLENNFITPESSLMQLPNQPTARSNHCSDFYHLC